MAWENQMKFKSQSPKQFCWNTAPHSHFPIVDSCVHATKAELNTCKTHTKPKILPVWPFKEEVS